MQKWHAMPQTINLWSHLKARQDVEFYNQGKVQLSKTNITRNVAAQS